MRDYEGGSLHDFLSTHYNIKIKQTINLISAKLPNQDDIELPAISGDSPLLLVKSVNVDQATGEPLESAISRYKGISTQLSVEPQKMAEVHGVQLKV